jgi:hypothetical protein
MMGGEATETCWATHKRQVMNLWNWCILLVDLFESYDEARTCKRQVCNSLDTAHVYANLQSLIRCWNFPKNILLATVFFKHLSHTVCCDDIKYWYSISEFHNFNKLCRRCISSVVPSVATICDEVSLRGLLEFPCVRKEKLLVASLLYMKLILHIPLGHDCGCTVRRSSAVCNCVV